MLQARRTPWRCSVGACLGLLAAVTAVAGPLDPPAGPVQPTMKRLDQLEPRRSLNDLRGSPDAARMIVEPGQYYLTADLQGEPGKHGVFVVCNGDVHIDLNGFSLHGAQGSLDGLHVVGGGGGRIAIVDSRAQNAGTSERLPASHRSARFVGWGGDCCSITGVETVTVSGFECSDAGGYAIRCLDVQKIVHRDIAARSCQLGGLFTQPAVAGASGRVSVQTTRCVVEACNGHGICCVRPTSGQFSVTIDSCDVSLCSGHGVCVFSQQASGGGGSVSIEACRCSDVGGDGVHVHGSPQARSIEVRAIRVELKRCAGNGISVADADTCDFDSCDISSCSLYGLESSRVRQLRSSKGVKFKAGAELSTTVSRCVAGGISSTDCDDVQLSGISVGDCDGDGVSIVRATTCACSHLRVADCDGDGLDIVDCGDQSTEQLSISRCDGDGIRSTWTNASAASSKHLLAHEAAHVVQTRGAGLRVICPSTLSTCDLGLSRCVISSCGADGIAIECPTSGSTIRVRCQDATCADNTGTGLRLRSHPNVITVLGVTSSRFEGNTGDGVSVASSDSSLSLRGGGQVCGTTSHFFHNGGSGLVSECPATMQACTFSNNGVDGFRCVAPDPFSLAGSFTDCVVKSNAGKGGTVPRGRYTSYACEFTDNTGDGLVCEMGCVLLENCHVQRSGGDGVVARGTLTVNGGAFRRNAGFGVRCTDGQCVARNMTCELNGTPGGTAGAGGGGAIFFDCTTVTLDRCVFNDNTGDGCKVSSSVGPVRWTAPEVIASRNTGRGFDLDNCNGGQLLRCVASGNGDLGIWARSGFTRGVIDGCVCEGNAGGLRVDGAGSVVVRNIVSNGPLGGFLVGPGNSPGQIVDGAALPQRCNPNDNVLH